MARYEETLRIEKDELDRINRLLAIPSLEEMTDDELKKAGAATDTCEGLYFVEFDDGSSLNIDLCSGTHNYFDDVVWTSPNGQLDVVLDCAYKLDDIEFYVRDDTYIVKIIKE